MKKTTLSLVLFLFFSLSLTAAGASFDVKIISEKHSLGEHEVVFEIENKEDISKSFLSSFYFKDTSFDVEKIKNVKVEELVTAAVSVPVYEENVVCEELEKTENATSAEKNCRAESILKGYREEEQKIWLPYSPSRYLYKTQEKLSTESVALFFTPKTKKTIKLSWTTPVEKTLKGFGSFGYYALVDDLTKKDYDPWWNSTWELRRDITINNTQNSDDLIDYQVAVNLTYDSDMQADFSDIRFSWYNTTSGSEAEIPYWIESKVNSAWAYIWVKVPYIPSNGYATIYVYYGNTTPVRSTSNGTAVFLLFDDFNRADSNVVGNGWVEENDGSENGIRIYSNKIQLTGGGSWMHLHKNYSYVKSSVVEYAVFTDETYSNEALGRFSSLRESFLNGKGINFGMMQGSFKYFNGAWQTITPYSANKWYKIKILNFDEYRFNVSINNSVYGNYTKFLSPINDTYTVAFGIYDSSRDAFIDDVFVRRFTIPEPTYLIGDEETPLWHFIEFEKFQRELTEQTINVSFEKTDVSNSSVKIEYNRTNYTATQQTINSTHIINHISFVYPVLIQSNSTDIEFYVYFDLNLTDSSQMSEKIGPYTQTLLYSYNITSFSIDAYPVEGGYLKFYSNILNYTNLANFSVILNIQDFNESLMAYSGGYYKNEKALGFFSFSGLSKQLRANSTLALSYLNTKRNMTSENIDFYVYKHLIVPCNSTFSTKVFEIKAEDEDDKSGVDIERNTTAVITYYINESYKKNATYYKMNSSFCIYPSWSYSYLFSDFIISKEDYSLTEHYHYSKYPHFVNNTTVDNVTVKMLQTSKSIPVTVRLPGEGYYIVVEKEYPDEFEYIKSSMSDFSKNAILYLRPYDTYYKIYVFDSGKDLCYETSRFKISLNSYSIYSCKDTSKATEYGKALYEDVVYKECNFNNDTKTLTCEYISLDSAEHNITLTVYKTTKFNKELFYQNSVIGSTGSMNVVLEDGYNYEYVFSSHSDNFSYIAGIISLFFSEAKNYMFFVLIGYFVMLSVFIINPIVGTILTIFYTMMLSQLSIVNISAFEMSGVIILLVFGILLHRRLSA